MTNFTNAPGSAGTYPIMVLGGRRTGKTTLCASLHQCLIARSHGLTSSLIARFPDANGLRHFENRLSDMFASPSALFQSQPLNQLVEQFEIGIDFTVNKGSLFSRNEDNLNGYYQFLINDLTGKFNILELVSKANHQGDVALQSELSSLYANLSESNSLVICHPASQNLAPSEANGFIHLMSEIAAGRYGTFDQIIVAFTKYERLFTHDKTDGLSNAVNPSTIIEVIANTIQNDQALETGLRALLGIEGGQPNLYCMPVSSFGFLPKNGAANLHRRTGEPLIPFTPAVREASVSTNPELSRPVTRLAGITIPQTRKASAACLDQSPQTVQQAIHSPNWLPFLSADPFLTAISGKPSSFMLPLASFITALDQGSSFNRAPIKRA